jgi:hypothetical protein
MNMAKTDPAFLGRRAMAKSSLLSGAALLLSARESTGARGKAAKSEWMDVRKFGAKGDGTKDDTMAIQRALDAAGEVQGAVFVPPGVYLCADLQMRPNTALLGIPTWDYRGLGGTALRISRPSAKCLLNIGGAAGVTIDGLGFDGAGMGNGVHGIFLDKPAYGDHEDGFRIERCRVARFTGDGLSLKRAWCFSVRYSMLTSNRGDGLSAWGYDGFLSHNWFSGNGRAGFAARADNASVTFTANRVEWNAEENVLITGADGYQITGNFFDRAGTCGIALRSRGSRNCSQMTISGNFFNRSGKRADAASLDSCHILIEAAAGVTCVGNNLQAGRDDGGKGLWTPSYGIVCGKLQNCVIANNVLEAAALRELIVDQGGHGPGVVLKDNPGSLFDFSAHRDAGLASPLSGPSLLPP